jgi:serine/threonine protein kinase/class 3 adenylate cyclase
MAELKTFLFTDIVSSVELKRAMPGRSDAERDRAFIELILSPHRARIDRDLAAQGGRVVSTAGDGHFLVFTDTVSAARWAIEIQQSHRDDPICTPAGAALAVRISMHIGTPQTDPRDENNFVGKPVDYAARLNDYATGGQILASRSVVAILEDAGMDGVSFHRHGRRDLKGIGAVDVFELVYDDSGPHKMRPQPRESASRQWTVLPAEMGLSEFQARGGRAEESTGLMTAPSKLGNYELTERLGGGGMGDVYKARHLQFGRERAVKVIKPHFIETEHREVIRRFYQEIKAVGALEHPNIVVAIDSSSPSDAIHYLVMEYIPGIAADELVAQHGPLALADACEIARQAARGLAYIYQHDMVHRDIKPSNLMLTVARSDAFDSDSGISAEPAGRRAVIKILDLGLALLVSDDQQRLTLFDDRPMGTAMYMSPEQWKTTSVDIRADIYSLGCALYHLLAGKPPFWDSDLRPQRAHEREKVPPIDVTPPIPKPVWEIIEKMTAKRPEDRYADPAEVATALAPWAHGHQLVRLVERVTNGNPSASTEDGAKNDTSIVGAIGSETRLAHSSAWWKRSSSLLLNTQRAWRKIATAAGAALALALLIWLIIQASHRRESVEAARQSHQAALQLAARLAASEIAQQIGDRFDNLNEVAKNSDLQKMMRQIDAAPKDESLWKPLEDKLGAFKGDYDVQTHADSWFITDAHGIQVARSPRSEASHGENFALRDYFHGQGVDLPAGTPPPKPIEEPHLSAVYRSTTSGQLRVAFSVPITNGRGGSSREILGVLAMSVDLAEFNVSDKELPAGYEIVLIDLRQAVIDGLSRRGLVLHLQTRKEAGNADVPHWIGRELLAQIDQALEAEKSSSANSSLLLSDYRDDTITHGQLYSGAIERIVDQRPEGESRDIHWLVVVQEPVEE